MPSKNLQNSPDGRLAQGRDWRQSTVGISWPAPGGRVGHPALGAPAFWPDSEEREEQTSGKH